MATRCLPLLIGHPFLAVVVGQRAEKAKSQDAAFKEEFSDQACPATADQGVQAVTFGWEGGYGSGWDL